ncbi:MAG: AbrB family transcriptional regulator [Yoonia sp.]|uniref:AbrB family transcriptional regulator n=1 Tax=Yoonia sp. TaxID=2212373 RepID=UPI00273EC29B|nr:AbrB family transcriptional regulator [Yoonia sp.]MDP5085507.1 AbrB family transcriptional regulator [Yoonia sp.]
MRLRPNTVTPHLAALAIGGGGGVLALGLGLPAAALIGSTFAVALAATLRLPLALHPRLRDLAFAVIGISLGAGVEAEALNQIGAWSVSLAMLLACLATTLFVGTVLLQRVFGMDRNTAILATSPGTMSNAIALALEGRGDATTILILQMIRLLVLVTIVPPVAMLIDADSGFAPATPMDLAPLAILVGVALALGLWGARAGIPAACLLFGMIVSAAAHVAGLAHGPAPTWVVNASFVITGAALGARLTAVTGSQLLRMSKAGLLLVTSAVAVSLCFAGLTHILTGLPLAQIWIAFAPGGVEAMAAIGLALGYDPAYVAIHHFARILALVVSIPFILSWFRS